MRSAGKPNDRWHTSAMQKLQRLRKRWALDWERRQLGLSSSEQIILLAGIGLFTGLLTAFVVLAFRVSIEWTQATFLQGDSENYEGLAWWMRLLLPTAGGLLIGLYFRYLTRPWHQEVGVSHVMNRMAYHQAYLSRRNAIHQFVGGFIAIVSGHSVGREGPSVHLGAATGSLLGQRLGLPNNTLRTLVACGSAAAIAASFNTPLAGVAFAMEIVMMEYSITGFLPVILASVVATVVVQAAYGATPVFEVPPITLAGLEEIPIVVFTGLVLGVLAAAVTYGVSRLTLAVKDRPLWVLTTLAGFLVGLISLLAPEVMSIGYDTVNAALQGELLLEALLIIAAAKIAATIISIGMGVPAGVIGPTLVIGACAGAAIGLASQWLFPGVGGSAALYAMLGMGAMMGATLRAPLAALTAMLELTANPNIIFPGMLIIVVATLVSSELCKQDSIFHALLRQRGLDPRGDMLLQGFHRLGIARVMDRRLAVLPPVVERTRLKQALEAEPRWILLADKPSEAPSAVVAVPDVLAYLAENEVDEIDLLKIPANRLQPAPIEIRATLKEALDQFRKTGAEALFVVQANAPGMYRHYGIITRDEIERRYSV